jgi:transposase
MHPRFSAGIDWSETLNDVAVVDNKTGDLVAHTRVAETPEGVKDVLRLYARLSTSTRHSRKHVTTAIETGQGLLVAALRSAGQPVVAINPTVVARYRGRIGPARKKSDRGDATLLASILRVDGPRHRPLPSNSDLADAIAVLARAQRRALHTRQYHYNQLRSLLRIGHPAMLSAWKPMPSGLLRPEARAVLAAGATPTTARRLTRRQLRTLLSDAGRTRMLDEHADRLHTLLRAKALQHPPAVEDAHGAAVLACLAALDQACTVVDDLTATTTAAFLDHPQSDIYLSFPGVGALTGARLLAELGDDPARFTAARNLRAYAGAAPLTWASGSASSITHRRLANKRLKATGHTWAFASLTRSAGCRAHYDRRRAAGDRNAAALRNLFGRLLTCLHHCLHHHVPYLEAAAFPQLPA